MAVSFPEGSGSQTRVLLKSRWAISAGPGRAILKVNFLCLTKPSTSVIGIDQERAQEPSLGCGSLPLAIKGGLLSYTESFRFSLLEIWNWSDAQFIPVIWTGAVTLHCHLLPHAWDTEETRWEKMGSTCRKQGDGCPCGRGRGTGRGGGGLFRLWVLPFVKSTCGFWSIHLSLYRSIFFIYVCLGGFLLATTDLPPESWLLDIILQS